MTIEKNDRPTVDRSVHTKELLQTARDESSIADYVTKYYEYHTYKQRLSKKQICFAPK